MDVTQVSSLPRPARRGLLTTLAVMAALGLGACGGSDGDAASGGSELQGAALSAKADAICQTGRTRSAAITAPADPDDLLAFYAYLEVVADTDGKTTDELAGVRASGDLAPALDDLVKARREANAINRKVDDAAQSFAETSGDKGGTDALEDVTASLDEQERLAKGLDPAVARINAAADALKAGACRTKPAV